MNHLYHKIPPRRSSVRGHSAYTYLDSEREIDAGEEPTLRVSEYLASRTLRILVNTWYANSKLMVPSQHSGDTLRRNPSPAGEKSSLSVYSFHRSPEWVAMCNTLLGCVRVGPRK